MIEIRNVTKIYNGAKAPALSNISLQVDRGEFVFLVGPSGAGKSTLLKLIFREHLPSSGRVFCFGRDTSAFREAELLKHRRRIGMVFQDFRLLRQKTVFENVAFALEVLGRSPREIRTRVPGVLERVGLDHKAKAFPAELSGGEQQRVGIARAIIRDPLIILADEPTGNVDRDNSHQLMELFEKINCGGTTVIIATHAWDIVDRMRKRVIALENGRIVRDERGGYSDKH